MKPRDRSLSYFELKNVDFKIKHIGDRISSLFPYLLEYHLFSQNFGIIKETPNNKKEYLVYDYEKSLLMEKDLENSNLQLKEALENLDEFLRIFSIEDDDQMVKLRQFVLKDQKILQILIYIVQLMDNLMNGDKNYQNLQEENQEIGLHKNRNPKIEIREENNAFNIGKKHLSNYSNQIYTLLYYCIKNNPKCSQVIILIPEY